MTVKNFFNLTSSLVVIIPFSYLGPVQPTAGYTLVLYAQGSSPADISWSYDG